MTTTNTSSSSTVRQMERYTFDSEEDEREVIEGGRFLEAWDDWHDSGIREDLTLDPMFRFLDLVHKQPRYHPGELFHNAKAPHECMCVLCVDSIIMFVHGEDTGSEFCEDNLPSIVYVWQRLRNIFPRIVDFRSFCCAVCSWNVRDTRRIPVRRLA